MRIRLNCVQNTSRQSCVSSNPAVHWFRLQRPVFGARPQTRRLPVGPLLSQFSSLQTPGGAATDCKTGKRMPRFRKPPHSAQPALQSPAFGCASLLLGIAAERWHRRGGWRGPSRRLLLASLPSVHPERASSNCSGMPTLCAPTLQSMRLCTWWSVALLQLACGAAAVLMPRRMGAAHLLPALATPCAGAAGREWCAATEMCTQQGCACKPGGAGCNAAELACKPHAGQRRPRHHLALPAIPACRHVPVRPRWHAHMRRRRRCLPRWFPGGRQLGRHAVPGCHQLERVWQHQIQPDQRWCQPRMRHPPQRLTLHVLGCARLCCRDKSALPVHLLSFQERSRHR